MKLTDLVELEEVDKQTRVKSFKQYPRPCEDCGAMTGPRTVNIRKLAFPEGAVKKTCANCKMSQHPETGEYSLTNSEFWAFLRPKKRSRDK